jgi:hypothetical protein
MQQFMLSNRLRATITELEDPEMCGVYQACKRMLTQECKRLGVTFLSLSKKEFFVLTIKVQGVNIHFVYNHWWLKGVPCNTATLLKNALKRNRWIVLREAWFVVYKRRAYEFENYKMAILAYSAEHNLAPNLATLLTPTIEEGLT